MVECIHNEGVCSTVTCSRFTLFSLHVVISHFFSLSPHKDQHLTRFNHNYSFTCNDCTSLETDRVFMCPQNWLVLLCVINLILIGWNIERKIKIHNYAIKSDANFWKQGHLNFKCMLKTLVKKYLCTPVQTSCNQSSKNLFSHQDRRLTTVNLMPKLWSFLA